MPYGHDFTLALVASSTLAIAATQSGAPNIALTLNGGLVVGGVAILDVPRRVGVVSQGNDSTKTFTIVGTDYYGRVQTEVLTGANVGAAQTAHDFATVTSITPSTTTASTITAGTTGTGSTVPWIVDQWANPNVYTVGTTVTTNTASYSIEKSVDNLFPAWDVNANTPTWYADSNFSGTTTNILNQIQGPLTMMRLTVTGGVGTVVARARQSYIAAN